MERPRLDFSVLRGRVLFLSVQEQCQLGAADQRLYCYLCSLFCTGALSSEVSALAHRAAPATIECHVI
jgi:hypothetical protein